MPVSRILFYLTLPAWPTGLILLAVLSIGGAFSLHAGYFGIPLGLMMLAWLFSYAYVLLEHIAHGAAEPPVLAIEMLNPAHEPRAMLQLLTVILVYSLLTLVRYEVNALLADLLAAMALISLPASIAVLALATPSGTQ